MVEVHEPVFAKPGSYVIMPVFGLNLLISMAVSPSVPVNTGNSNSLSPTLIFATSVILLTPTLRFCSDKNIVGFHFIVSAKIHHIS